MSSTIFYHTVFSDTNRINTIELERPQLSTTFAPCLRTFSLVVALTGCAASSAQAPHAARLAAAALVEVASSTGGRCRATGSAVHLGNGLYLTVAHVVDGSNQRMRNDCPVVRPALTLKLRGVTVPATLVFAGRYRIDPVFGQRYFAAEDLALLTPQQAGPSLPAAALCAAPPLPGAPAVLVFTSHATRTRITRLAAEPDIEFGAYLEIPVQLEPGASGGALFDATSGCLSGLVSHRDNDNGPPVARLVPASTIRRFVGTCAGC